MSDDNNDTPFNFPHSEPNYYPEIIENDERVESTKIWQPETLQIMEDHASIMDSLQRTSKMHPSLKKSLRVSLFILYLLFMT